MLSRITIPTYSPDQPIVITPCGNMIALPTGYRPAFSLSPVTPALTGLLGAASFRSIEGDQSLVAGTASALYYYSSGAWVAALSGLSAQTWRYAQFGDNLLCVNGGAPITFVLGANTAAPTAGSPPPSDIVATVRDFVMLAGDPSATNQLTNSFPTGGAITGIAGGQNGVILFEHKVELATLVGGTVVWQFDEISSEIGCMAKGSVMQAGNLVFFLSDHGFMVCDRTTVTPIGQEIIDRTFFTLYSRNEIKDNIRASIDPQTTEVVWSMPGTPGALFRYNYLLKQWSPPAMVSVSTVFSGFSQSYSLEELNGLYPGGIETIPLSLDATKWAGGDPALYVVDATGAVNTATGPSLPGYFTFYPTDLQPGSRVRVRGCRLVSDIIEGTVSLDVRARDGDTATFVKSSAIRPDGRSPIRANGRHLGIRIDVPAGADWTFLNAIDVEYEVEGWR